AARVENLRRVHLDLEALRYLHLGDRQLVGRRRDGEGRDRRHLRAGTALGPSDRPERRPFFFLLGGRRKWEEREHQAGGGERQYPIHSVPPWATTGHGVEGAERTQHDGRSWPRTLARTAAARKAPPEPRLSRSRAGAVK